MGIALLATIILSVFSTAVMSYISMAIPIGPWIAPTVVLLALSIFKVFSCYHADKLTRYSALTTSAASIGGILATGIGFSYPAIYFLAPDLFDAWLLQPLFFAVLLGGLALSAGALGIWFAHMLSDGLIVQQSLPFPIGNLIYKMIAAHQSIRKSLELIGGLMATTFFCILQDGFGVIRSLIPKFYTLMSAAQMGFFSIPMVRFELWPLLWAIGFVTGHVIAVPLALGALAKVFILDTCNAVLFPKLSNSDFILAFCSGMVLVGAIQGFIGIPSLLITSARKFLTRSAKRLSFQKLRIDRSHLLEGFCVLALAIIYLWYLRFSWISQIYLLLFTLAVTYQLALIAGKIGLAPLGRFATFVMAPALFLFKLDVVQIVMIATFVEVCAGVTADALFSLKMAQLGEISRNQIRKYQYSGLLISALVVGLIFWLLISHFHIGSSELYAQKAQARALFINAYNFDFIVLIIGVLFGMLVKYLKINPALMLSGILMPLNLSIGLIVGGLLTSVVKNREEWYPFWSGVFAANSIWMLLKTLF